METFAVTKDGTDPKISGQRPSQIERNVSIFNTQKTYIEECYRTKNLRRSERRRKQVECQMCKNRRDLDFFPTQIQFLPTRDRSSGNLKHVKQTWSLNWRNQITPEPREQFQQNSSPEKNHKSKRRVRKVLSDDPKVSFLSRGQKQTKHTFKLAG